MSQILFSIGPNLSKALNKPYTCLPKQGIYSILAGLFFGVILVLTREDGLKTQSVDL
ncbi:hypothetical protein [Erysipelothrix piscisicarius]|uniref:hypothetical protein n=1 Tax=Erysipelothrix piscisicarius TaxID=2485784 RepID=UPI002F95DD15